MILNENQSIVNTYLASASLTLVVLLFSWVYWNKRPPNSPPGSNGFPLLGAILSLTSFPQRALTKLGKKYGPIYMVYFGNTAVVVLGNPEIAHEAFAKNDCFNDRPQTIPILCSGKGLIMINASDFQREQRRFNLHALREFGMGRKKLEGRLVDVSRQLCKTIDDLCGNSGTSKPFPINEMIYQSISSVISYIIFNHDVTVDDEVFGSLLKEMTETKKENILSGVLMFAPKLKYLPFFSKMWRKSGEFRDKIEEKIKEEVLSHQKSHDRNNPRDFIDCFLNEMNNFSSSKSSGQINKNCDQSDEMNRSYSWQSSSSFTIGQLISSVRDLFMAGTETTASTICWIILFLSHYQDVQEKMQKEIDEVLGQSGVPSMDVLEKLPYVRVVLQEVSRLRPTVPLSVPHMASRDAILNGYVIPKGAIILTNIWGIQHDESRWPEPEKFLPERHLDNDGKFNKSSNWMIFNLGLRNCLGQQLAKMELFIATVSLFQKFSFALPPGTTPDMEGEPQVTLRPNLFEVIATRR
ncbi:cytochrome P450 2U1-like [Clavelina lepadiformis]|uniref:cytochrome P450 2U1-like n=1 Tax=Clavelina lepadiformis TaxID=159417 RepID=UPI0040430B82